MNVVRGAHTILFEEPAHLRGLVRVVAVALFPRLLAPCFFAQFQPRGRRTVVVVVPGGLELRLGLLRGGAHVKEQVEEPVEGAGVLPILDQRRPQRVAHDLPLPKPDLPQRVQRVYALGGGDPELVMPQGLHEIVYYGVHAPSGLLVGMLVGAAAHLAHSLRGVLAARLLLAEVLARLGVDAEVVEHLLGFAVVFGDHADGVLNKFLAVASPCSTRPRPLRGVGEPRHVERRTDFLLSGPLGTGGRPLRRRHGLATP